MKVLRAIANAFCLFIRILIYEWLPALVAIYKSLYPRSGGFPRARGERRPRPSTCDPALPIGR